MLSFNSKTRFLRERICLVCLLACFCASFAWAQDKRLDEPSIGDKTIAGIVERLDLDKNEAAVVRELHAAMAQSYRARSARVRELRSAADRAIEQRAENAKELQAQWYDEWVALIVARNDSEKQLLADIRSTLTPAQLEDRWPGVLRWVRRGDLAFLNAMTVTRWHRVDFVACVEEAALSQAGRSAIAEVLERYEHEVDRPLQERWAMWDEEMHWPAEKQQQMDEELQARNMQIGSRVGEITKSHAKWAISLLAEEDRRRLTTVMDAIVYSGIVSLPRPASSAIAKARTLADLTAGQRDEVESIATRYGRASSEADTLARDVFDHKDLEVPELMRMPQAQRAEKINFQKDPVSEAWLHVSAARAEIEQSAMAELRALLTPDQRRQVGLEP